MWEKVLDSSDTKWGGNGNVIPEILSKETRIDIPALSCIIYTRKDIE